MFYFYTISIGIISFILTHIKMTIGPEISWWREHSFAHQSAKDLLFAILQDKPPLDDLRDTMIKNRPFRLNPRQYAQKNKLLAIHIFTTYYVYEGGDHDTDQYCFR